MQIQCPFCQFPIMVKGAKPGGYRPPCPRCKRHYVLVIANVQNEQLLLLGESLESLAPVPGTTANTSPAATQTGGPPGRAEASGAPDAEPAGPNDTASASDAPTQPPRQAQPQNRAATSAATAAAAGSAAPPARAGLTGSPPRRRAEPGQAGLDVDTSPHDATATRPPAGPRAAVAATQSQAASRAGDPDATRNAPAPAGSAALAAPAPSATPSAAPSAAPASPAAVAALQAGDDVAMPKQLNGYRIEELLGEGGMGAVYLARQISLDRDVAVKTIKPELAENPVFLSRFTREAYAAAQLTHHNVVQIHDIGEDERTYYFSMEYVPGRSLADYLRLHGALDVEEAAGYILQAARGLKFAHDHGMVHRDIKPGNLLLNDHGVVKVADLGLVKTSGSSPAAGHAQANAGSSAAGADPLVTAPTAMGTPAYMAPEQAQDAAHVDGRADIYSLGCTFYALTTGRPMFEGTTAAELITKHSHEPVTPPEQIASRVPRSVSAIIMKMVAKKPEDRYANVDELIAALEDFLGISAGPFTPRKEHANALEAAVEAFNDAPLARVRGWLMLGFTAACAIMFLFGALNAMPALVAGAITLWLFTATGYAVIHGARRRSFVFRKVRQLLFGSRPHEWISWATAALLMTILVLLLGLGWIVLLSALLGLVLAAGLHFSVDNMAERERRPYVDEVREMLKSMRLRGLEEDAVRRFVCKYSGEKWEEFYETLFGYEAKMQARRLWGTDDEGRPRKKQGAWRDGLIRWIDQKQQRREAEKQRHHLEKIEARRLKAEGKSDAEASRDAERLAEEMVEKAVEYKETGAWQPIAGIGGVPPTASDRPRPRERRTPRQWLLDLLLGGRARFLVGGAMLSLYAIWVRQNDALWDIFRGAPGVDALRRYVAADAPPVSPPGFESPGVLLPLLGPLSSHGAGLTGLLLLLSAFHIGRRMTYAMLPAIAVLVIGPMVADYLPEPVFLTGRETVLVLGLLLGVIALLRGGHRAST